MATNFSYTFGSLIPTKYRVSELILDPVFSSVQYQDAGKEFNENSETVVREWDFLYSGLSQSEATLLDEMFGANWYSRSFSFTDKAGVVHTSCYIKENSYRSDHNNHKSWIQTRSFTVIKFDAAVPDYSAPTTPTNFAATANGQTQIDLTWTASTDDTAVTGYEYRLNGGSWVDVSNVTSYSVTGLSSETLYNIDLRAYDAAGNKSEAANDSETTDAPDATVSAFLTATSISDTTIENALNALVSGLISDGVYSKLQAVYPMVGGTADTHKYNLKDTSAYTIDWEGTVTHDSNGITGNGSDGLGRTNYVPSSDATSITNHSFGVYIRNSVDGINRAIGARYASSSTYNFIIPYNGGDISARYGRTGSVVITNNSGNSQGFFGVSCRATGSIDIRDNGNTSNESNTEADLPTYEYALLGQSTSASASSFHSTHNIAFAFIGQGLTPTEMGNLKDRVETFQDALSRGVIS